MSSAVQSDSQTAVVGPLGSTRSRCAVAVIALLLIAHAVLALDTARQSTVTHDEYWHVPIGLLNWKTGRFDFDTLNPPLIRLWAAIPLLFGADPALDRSPGEMEGWGDLFLEANMEEYQFWLTLARSMIVLLSVGTGVLISVWAWQWFGPGAACLTALLWSFCPNILAHGSLVTTDLGAAFFFALVLYLVWKHAERPTWRRTFWLGLALGLAQLAKFTCIVLYPLAVLLWLVLRGYSTREGEAPAEPRSASIREGEAPAEPRSLRTLLFQSLAALGISLLVLNAGYLFRGSFAPLAGYSFESEALSRLDAAPAWLQQVPVPLPRDYLVGLDRQRRVMESEHPVYLDGEWRTDGFPLYYLKTLLYKLPHPAQLLLILTGIWLFLTRKDRIHWRRQLFLVVPPVALLTIASGAGQQLGVRYILPVFPLLFLFAGQSARWLNWRKYRLRTATLLLLIVAIPISLRHHPHHLAYFNELAGGPAGGRHHLLDSNLDWGQDLHRLKAYLDEHPVPDLGLAYFGTMSPEALGIRYHLPPSRVPEPGWYAVSVNFVQGRPHLLRDGRGGSHPAGIDEYGYFRFFDPTARIGYSIDLYHLTEMDVIRYRTAVRNLLREAQP